MVGCVCGVVLEGGELAVEVAYEGDQVRIECGGDHIWLAGLYGVWRWDLTIAPSGVGWPGIVFTLVQFNGYFLLAGGVVWLSLQPTAVALGRPTHTRQEIEDPVDGGSGIPVHFQ